MELPDAIRSAALFPETDLPDFPPGHPARRVEIDGTFVLVPGTRPAGVVFPQRVEEGGIERLVGAVRELLRAEGREKALWMVAEAAEPPELAERLLALGMKHGDVPGAEERHAEMVCLSEPPPGPPGVVAREAETLDEFLAGMLAIADAFADTEDARKAIEERAEKLWSFRGAVGDNVAFVALAGDDVIAFGSARFGRTAVYLGGAGTHPDHRGRGAYRALVRARWDAAVERGTPVLTIGAGAMSRPILERLGFSIVGWRDCLVDELG